MTRPPVGPPGYALLSAATVGRLADNTAPVAVVLLVIARTGDARLAGLLVAAFTVPTLIAGPVLGAYLDRLPRKRLLFTASQLVLALDLAALLVATGHVPGWALAALAFAAGATSPVTTSGYSSLVPLVVPPAALGRANALDSASYGLAGIAGPAVVSALAGAFGVTAGFAALVAVAVLGVPLVLAAPMPAQARGVGAGAPAGPGAAASLAAQAATPAARPASTMAAAEATAPAAARAATPAAARAATRATTRAATRATTRAEGSLRSEIADGLRLLRRSRELLSVTVATTAGQFFQGPLPVLLPLLAIALGRPASGGGWLLAAFSAGGLLGALASDRLIARWGTRPVLAGSLAGLAGFLALLAVTPSFWGGLAVAALAGLADGPSLAATFTVRQLSVPPERYAQVLATAASLKIAAFSAGSAAAGLLTGAGTVRELLLGIAAGQLLSAAALLSPRRPGHRQAEDQGFPERGPVSPEARHCP